jgi:UMF1 family MFS transporter
MSEVVSQPAVQASSMSTRRERIAWYLYDFGNSAYAAVVLLAIYSAYFQGEVVGGAQGSRLWGYAVGIAMLFVALTAPVLGTIADFSGSKKRFLFFYTAVCCTFTALLFFVGPGDVVTGMLFFILAEIGYRSAQVFYNSLLPEIAADEDMSRISGNGWAIGSAGGILCLVIVLVLIMFVEGEGVVHVAFPITGAFFAISATPVFLWIRERAKPQQLPAGDNYLTMGFQRLAKTFRSVRIHREYIKFMVSFLIYNDGIIMALDFAAILGAVLFGMEQQQLIVFMIIVQITSIAGAYLFGLLADRIDPKQSLIAALLMMIAAAVWMYFNYSLTGFYLIGGLAGFALTGVQSVSRAAVGLFAPRRQSAEFYGFFAIAGRTSSFIGPAVYGVLAYRAALWFQDRGLTTLVAEQQGQRFAILSIIAFLLVGLVLLLTVNVKRAQEQPEVA